jgi:selenocysteine-specific elongation factor
MAKQLILGTAGHIDHGKTSLIRSLTGIDTDRLKEEKARGITIELGFAHLTLPGGVRIGIVDVPGHEKFVRHMVAGATGVDMVSMVIAADEGVMPQTREHLEICELLGARYGLIVLTKIDLVDEDWLELVEEDVREFVAGTFLENAPVVYFSAADGRGREDVLEAISGLIARVEERQAGGLFRMPLDRVFTMKGFGTVVTGTAISGRLAVADTVMVYPGEITTKVRGLQVHGQSVESVEAGLRTAINLQGLEKSSIERGQVLGPPDMLSPSRRVDLWVRYLASNEKPLKNRTQVRYHVGTSENLGRLLLLDRDELAPGDSAPAQILLDEEDVALAGDRFVLRSYSPVRTIGGGEILNPHAMRHKRFHERTLADLSTLKDHDPIGSLNVLIESSGPKGTSQEKLSGLIDLPASKIKAALGHILSRQQAVVYDKERGRIVGRDVLDQLGEHVIEILEKYHRDFPVRPGLGKEELKTRVKGLSDPKLLAFLLDRLSQNRNVIVERDLVRLAGHEVSLAGDFQKIEEQLIRVYQKGGLTPPYLKDVAGTLAGSAKQHKEVVEHLVKQGTLIKVKTDLYYHRDALEQVWDRARTHLKNTGELTTPEFKDMTGLSRKYLIPLLEYFDARGLTMRVGEKRVLRSES